VTTDKFTTAAATAHNDYQLNDRREYGRCQVEITAAATVKIQGRIAVTAPWVDLKTYTASGADVVALFPEMRIDVTGNTGTVNGWLRN
jgi:hypothetical protein